MEKKETIEPKKLKLKLS